MENMNLERAGKGDKYCIQKIASDNKSFRTNYSNPKLTAKSCSRIS